MKLCLDREDALVFFAKSRADSAVTAARVQTRVGTKVYAEEYAASYYIVVSDGHNSVYVQEL